jgi:hypothetical protein
VASVSASPRKTELPPFARVDAIAELLEGTAPLDPASKHLRDGAIEALHSILLMTSPGAHRFVFEAPWRVDGALLIGRLTPGEHPHWRRAPGP